MKEEFILWRIWLEKGIPLDELKYKWTYPDLIKANALLDMEKEFKNTYQGFLEYKRGND